RDALLPPTCSGRRRSRMESRKGSAAWAMDDFMAGILLHDAGKCFCWRRSPAPSERYPAALPVSGETVIVRLFPPSGLPRYLDELSATRLPPEYLCLPVAAGVWQRGFPALWRGAIPGLPDHAAGCPDAVVR